MVDGDRTEAPRLCGLAIGLAIIASFVARALTGLIDLATNLAFFGRFSLAPASPAESKHPRVRSNRSPCAIGPITQRAPKAPDLA